MLSVAIDTTQTIRATFTDDDGLYDPSSLSLVIQSPAGVTTTLTGSIVRESAGVYTCDVAFTATGVWSWSWRIDDTAKLKLEGQVFVRPPLVS